MEWRLSTLECDETSRLKIRLLSSLELGEVSRLKELPLKRLEWEGSREVSRQVSRQGIRQGRRLKMDSRSRSWLTYPLLQLEFLELLKLEEILVMLLIHWDVKMNWLYYFLDQLC